jgi:hypothetical protein
MILSRAGRRLKKISYSDLIARLLAVVMSAVLIATALDRISIGRSVADRYPLKAFGWIRSNEVVFRPFHTIGHGSFLVWDLYGERFSFIDGRNFSPGLYRDFLACQMNEQGRKGVTDKYHLDAFILPPIEQSDAGIERIHRSLIRDKDWTLSYLDQHAWIYVKNSAVDDSWLAENGYLYYHPLTLHNRRMQEAEIRLIQAELERAVKVSPDYSRTRLDLAMVYLSAGDEAAASVQLDFILEHDPQHKDALDIRGRLRDSGRR